MARELLREQQIIRELLAADTGQTIERIASDFDRDLFMDPTQAKNYGIIDEILTRETLQQQG
jgi:ATP-dependent Clp protease protease subunit